MSNLNGFNSNWHKEPTTELLKDIRIKKLEHKRKYFLISKKTYERLIFVENLT